MYTVTIVRTAQGYVAAAKQNGSDVQGTSRFVPATSTAATQALADLEAQQERVTQRAAALENAAAQARLPLDERMSVPSSLAHVSSSTRRMYACAPGI